MVDHTDDDPEENPFFFWASKIIAALANREGGVLVVGRSELEAPGTLQIFQEGEKVVIRNLPDAAEGPETNIILPGDDNYHA